MTDTKALLELADEGKRCFTYCGDDLCNCPARDAFSTLAFVSPALPVLSAMCATAGLKAGAAKANEMEAAVRNTLAQEQSK